MTRCRYELLRTIDEPNAPRLYALRCPDCGHTRLGTYPPEKVSRRCPVRSSKDEEGEKRTLADCVAELVADGKATRSNGEIVRLLQICEQCPRDLFSVAAGACTETGTPCHWHQNDAARLCRGTCPGGKSEG